uniref:Uncharacterized protein n=1 Tax=Siphoviridae sp. ctet217 TaxID=2826409 RepID=A0A8S5MFC6_9CAUD|nr:MAG TPA: hypothetical protein [Siphoviridae sp. ctet217]
MEPRVVETVYISTFLNVLFRVCSVVKIFV